MQTSGAWRREIVEARHVCATSIASESEAIQNLSAARFWIASAYATERFGGRVGGRGEGLTQPVIARSACDEAIQTFDAARTGLLRGACQRAGVRPARWLAMTWQESTISRRHAPEVCKKFSRLRKIEGAGNAGCSMHPQASRAKKKKRTRSHKVHRKQTAFPAQWC